MKLCADNCMCCVLSGANVCQKCILLTDVGFLYSGCDILACLQESFSASIHFKTTIYDDDDDDDI